MTTEDPRPRDAHGLPENAFRELAPGETYRPIVPAEASVPDITVRSVLFGLAMTILFSLAAAYVALKLGQGIESAIPIAILAIGFSALLARKSTLLENVTIVTFGATAGIIVGGAVFVMPAVYILGLEGQSSFFQIFIVPLLGAILGILFLIPFRRYFVADMHGKLPFPEATATTEILVAGARGGQQARTLLYAMGVGIALDFMALNLRLWRDTFSTAVLEPLHGLTENLKAVFLLNTSAAVLGLGYIIGVRYASAICAGSFLSYWVLVPVFGKLGDATTGAVFAGRPPLAGLGWEDLFFEHVRYVGIGGIFGAGVLSILKMSPVIVQALNKVGTEMKRLRGRGGEKAPARTERDLTMAQVIGGTVILSALLFIYFRFAVLASRPDATGLALAALAITLVVAFLFAAVSAWAVATISITPVSGMTLTTLIISAVLLNRLGLTGTEGMVAVLLIGGVVCTALSMTGSLVTLFKVGYWIGATPRKIQVTLAVGSVLAALTVTAAIVLFAHTHGFVASERHPQPMAAPQANAMAAVIQSVMASAEAPWFLFGLGGMIAVLVALVGVSPLAFALGMYLPMDLNTPILAGAVLAWFVRSGAGSEVLARARANRGTLIASGLIAGGALAGVLDAIVMVIRESIGRLPGEANHAYLDGAGNWVGLAVFGALMAGVYRFARRARAEEGAGPEIQM
ncbi:MAG: oligopeptide transporter, OPT family [Candidatus Krumholzibacteria bacterium]|nr:oligopeptide transporter, OPT family [Candidatus Krumholzibacteria bacterium]